jgi:hypothetical protein
LCYINITSGSRNKLVLPAAAIDCSYFLPVSEFQPATYAFTQKYIFEGGLENRFWIDSEANNIIFTINLIYCHD